MVVVLVGGSAGWRKLRLLQCLLSQLQIDGRGGQKVKDYRRLPLPFNLSPQTRGFQASCSTDVRIRIEEIHVSDLSHTNHPAM